MTAGTIRQKVREVLAMVPSRRFTEQMICNAVNELELPEKVELSEVKKAIDWNHESGFIEYKHNREYGRDEWFITDRGLREEKA